MLTITFPAWFVWVVVALTLISCGLSFWNILLRRKLIQLQKRSGPVGKEVW